MDLPVLHLDRPVPPERLQQVHLLIVITSGYITTEQVAAVLSSLAHLILAQIT